MKKVMATATVIITATRTRSTLYESTPGPGPGVFSCFAGKAGRNTLQEETGNWLALVGE